MGEHKEAVENFSTLINYASDVLKDRLNTKVLIFNLRGKEYTELKDYTKAIDNFSETLRLKQEYDETYPLRSDDDDEAFLLCGKAYYLTGEKEKAKAGMEEYINRKRNVADATSRSKIFQITGVKPEDIL